MKGTIEAIIFLLLLLTITCAMIFVFQNKTNKLLENRIEKLENINTIEKH